MGKTYCICLSTFLNIILHAQGKEVDDSYSGQQLSISKTYPQK
jgi:hypothetical protein